MKPGVLCTPGRPAPGDVSAALRPEEPHSGRRGDPVRPPPPAKVVAGAKEWPGFKPGLYITESKLIFLTHNRIQAFRASLSGRGGALSRADRREAGVKPPGTSGVKPAPRDRGCSVKPGVLCTSGQGHESEARVSPDLPTSMCPLFYVT